MFKKMKLRGLMELELYRRHLVQSLQEELSLVGGCVLPADQESRQMLAAAGGSSNKHFMGLLSSGSFDSNDEQTGDLNMHILDVVCPIINFS